MKKLWRIMVLCICLVLVLAFSGMSAAAAESGTCGENLTWTLDETGTLRISGTGPMEDWDYSYSKAPWRNGAGTVKNVVIEEGVTSIGNYAFVECLSFVSAAIPESVTKIGAGAFSACSELKQVTLPQNLNTIGDYAFSSCTSLTEISVPDSVERVGVNPFSGCTGLPYRIYDNAKYLGNEQNPYLLLTECSDPLYTTDCQIHPDTKWICGDAFNYCINLKAITIPDSVVDIGDGAFASCRNLTSVSIGNGVTRIGRGAFSYCEQLYTVHMGNHITSIEAYAFSDCGKLEQVYLPDSLTYLDSLAFENCRKLRYNNYGGAYYLGSEEKPYLALLGPTSAMGTSCQVHEDTRVICDNAFRYSGQLETVTIPAGVVHIGENIFESCNALSCVYYGGSQEQLDALISDVDNEKAFANLTVYYNHIHDYTPTLRVEPTCTEAGSVEYTCAHGDTYREVLPALDHNLIYSQEVQPTCTEPGLTEGFVCDRCDYTTQQPLEMLEHSYEDGLCTLCGKPDRKPGDLDGDDAVSTEDVVALLLYISMPDMFNLPEGVNADFTGDSLVNTEDAVTLLLHISMPDMFPLTGKKE